MGQQESDPAHQHQASSWSVKEDLSDGLAVRWLEKCVMLPANLSLTIS